MSPKEMLEKYNLVRIQVGEYKPGDFIFLLGFSLRPCIILEEHHPSWDKKGYRVLDLISGRKDIYFICKDNCFSCWTKVRD